MSTGYALAYRLGLTPWEKAGRDAAVQFNALLDREQQASHPSAAPWTSGAAPAITPSISPAAAGM